MDLACPGGACLGDTTRGRRHTLWAECRVAPGKAPAWARATGSGRSSRGISSLQPSASALARPPRWLVHRGQSRVCDPLATLGNPGVEVPPLTDWQQEYFPVPGAPTLLGGVSGDAQIAAKRPLTRRGSKCVLCDVDDCVAPCPMRRSGRRTHRRITYRASPRL